MSRCQRTAKISSFSLEEEKIDCYQRGNISRFKFERAGERERMRERVRESVRERESEEIDFSGGIIRRRNRRLLQFKIPLRT